MGVNNECKSHCLWNTRLYEVSNVYIYNDRIKSMSFVFGSKTNHSPIHKMTMCSSRLRTPHFRILPPLVTMAVIITKAKLLFVFRWILIGKCIDPEPSAYCWIQHESSSSSSLKRNFMVRFYGTILVWPEPLHFNFTIQRGPPQVHINRNPHEYPCANTSMRISVFVAALTGTLKYVFFGMTYVFMFHVRHFNADEHKFLISWSIWIPGIDINVTLFICIRYYWCVCSVVCSVLVLQSK